MLGFAPSADCCTCLKRLRPWYAVLISCLSHRFGDCTYPTQSQPVAKKPAAKEEADPDSEPEDSDSDPDPDAVYTEADMEGQFGQQMSMMGYNPRQFLGRRKGSVFMGCG